MRLKLARAAQEKRNRDVLLKVWSGGMMLGLLLRVLLAGLAALSCDGPAGADTLLLGNTDGSNCIPFNCATQYQQLYTNEKFNTPVLISDLQFFNNLGSSSEINSADVTLALVTSRSITVESFASGQAFIDIAHDSTVFVLFDEHLSQTTVPNGGSLDIKAPTPFLYNPTSGLLLLQIELTAASTGGLDVDSASDGVFSRAYLLSGGSATSGEVGLVTQFVFTAVPEPMLAAYLASGLLLLGSLSFRRRLTICAPPCAAPSHAPGH